MAHTAGPWTAWDDDGTGTLPCVLSKGVTEAGNFYVAQCNVYADARLISAAPDLLAACEVALPWLERDAHVDVTAQVRAAVAKAWGA